MRHLLILAIIATFYSCSSGATVDKEITTDTTTDGILLPGDSGEHLDLGELNGDGKTNPSDSVVTPPKPGEFGAPCTSNEDCLSGYCIEGLDGYICTKICVEDCPEGYDCIGVSIGADLIFICAPLLDRSCELCSSDLQCSGGRCIQFGQSNFCLMPCNNGTCKNTYSCEKVSLEGGIEELCMPTSGTCECGPDSLGLEKSCKQKSGVNVCYGIQFCEENGWSDCDLPSEICDNKDNDCNGIIDDGMLNPSTGKYDTSKHCGVCNNSCTAMSASNASGTCQTGGAVPVCGWICEDNYFDVNDNPNDGCECSFESDEDDPDVPGDANCDGLDGVLSQGLFVAKNGNDDNAGTLEEPLLTIQAGIDLADSGNKKSVFVATGVYTESVLLPEEVNIYGGYSADFMDRIPAVNQTVIMGHSFSAGLPGAVNGVDILAKTSVLSGFHIFGGNALESGGSSYGVYLKNVSDRFIMRGNWVMGGSGRDGEHAEDGSDGTDGKDGKDGDGAYDIMKESCTAGDWTLGGSGGSTLCNGANVNGGSGGSGICPDHDESGSQPKSQPYDQTQKAEEFGGPGNGPEGGSGGEPGYDGLLWSGAANCGVCNIPKTQDGSQFLPSLGTDGTDGADGSDGNGAGGCVNPVGSVNANLWVGIPGSWGGDGSHGSGGGGGGAGGGVETKDCSWAALMKYTDIGGSGGGGGSGGCRGTGGEGGQPGGGSFAVFLVGDSEATALPEITGNVIQTGFGGDGGDGGAGGVAGDGGQGAAGGYSGESEGSAWCADAGIEIGRAHV